MHNVYLQFVLAFSKMPSGGEGMWLKSEELKHNPKTGWNKNKRNFGFKRKKRSAK